MGQSCSGFSTPSGTVYVCDKKDPLWKPLEPAVPTIIVAVVGFWIVHHLSKRRQRRDETFKLVEKTRDLVVECAAVAGRAWRVSGYDRKLPALHEDLLSKVGRLGRMLEMLRKRDRRLDVQEELTAFRQAATTDVMERSRRPSEDRATDIAALGGRLELAIDQRFLRVYR